MIVVQMEEKSMVPTIVVGLGGTGAEVISRVRRLIEDSCKELSNFPIISFLAIDTDKDYKINNPEASGSPLKDNEMHWASVSGRQVNEMVSNMERYPWLSSWFPSELERNIASLEAGAGQIRACGRFAFFCNYHSIQKKFLESVRRIKGRESFMLDRYGIKVNNNAINVFVTGSLAGGTGSGMLLDVGYSISKWLQGEGSPLITAIVPMPEAFKAISVGDRVLANGYAALMELSYFSDYRTEYRTQFSNNLTDEIRSLRAPFDYTYLVGTKNGESNFKLDQIRETIAQNIFLDLTSDFSPHKRSIRDNIKGAWAQSDPGGRGYPKNFMSFGISTIEIPIEHIRAALTNKLAGNLVHWWLNESATLPPQMLELLKGNILKQMRLTESELLTDLMEAADRPYSEVISAWINDIRNEITAEEWLQCTNQGLPGRTEKGKVLEFVDGYIKPKVDEYVRDHFREATTDERLHGDFLGKMYDNRERVTIAGHQALINEFYSILSDRSRGPQFAKSFIVTTRQILTDSSERFREHQDKIWAPKENERRKQYESELSYISDFKHRFAITKKSHLEFHCEEALVGLEGSLIALIQRKSRVLALEVIERMKETLNELENRFNQFNQILIQTRDYFERQAEQEVNSADALEINGIKLYDRQELNVVYQDLIEQLAGSSPTSKSRYESGLESVCGSMSENILRHASLLWKDSRATDKIMELFDITEIPNVRLTDFQAILSTQARQVLISAPENSRLKRDLAACDRLFKVYDDTAEVSNNIRIAYNKSKPLILMNQAILSSKDAGFTPATNTNVALVGGRKTSDPAAQKLLPILDEFIGDEEAIKPLGFAERHRVVFVQEMGGFSLRCIDGMQELRQSYQDWQGENIEAKRAQIRGESRDLPIPVHLQKEPPFWDIFPEDPKIFRLVVCARALNVLHKAENQMTRENVIRYVRSTAIGPEDVDIASSWEEVSQVLEIRACQADREEIQHQVSSQLDSAETELQKRDLFNMLLDYLDNRVTELKKSGGKDSPEYKRESSLLLEIIDSYNLKVEASTPAGKTSQATFSIPEEVHEVIPNVKEREQIFCTNCGEKNPGKAKFCWNCGQSVLGDL